MQLSKKNIIVIVVFVIVLVLVGIKLSYSYFLAVDSGEDNVISVGDLKVSFCVDETCKKDYPNFGKVIGTKTVNGQSVIENIYPYETDEEALKNDPYVFNIKNTGSLKTFVTIRLTEDKDYIPEENKAEYFSLTSLYSNNIKVGISKCNDGIDPFSVVGSSYGSLEDNIIVDREELDKGDEITYCLWTWLDNETPNEVQNAYFVANLSFKAEYLPERN